MTPAAMLSLVMILPPTADSANMQQATLTNGATLVMRCFREEKCNKLEAIALDPLETKLDWCFRLQDPGKFNKQTYQ